MPNKIVIAASVIIAIIEGLAPGVVPMAILPLLLVLLGLVYGVIGVDAEDPVAYLAVAIAIGAAGGADVLGHIHVIGSYLDAIVDQVAVVLLSGGVAIMVMRAWNRLSAADDSD